MDRFEKFYYSEVRPASEGIVEGALAAAFTFTIGGIVIYMKAMSKKNAAKVASTRNAYFDAHDIPENERATYASKVEKLARADFESALRQVVSNPKKSGLDKVKAQILAEIKDYIDDEEPNVFEPAKVSIDVTTRYSTEYEVIDANYNGKGFIPADNVWEIAQQAMRPIVMTICDNISKKYAEEIKCGFLRIDRDSQYATVDIYAPKR